MACPCLYLHISGLILVVAIITHLLVLLQRAALHPAQGPHRTLYRVWLGGPGLAVPAPVPGQRQSVSRQWTMQWTPECVNTHQKMHNAKTVNRKEPDKTRVMGMVIG